MIDESNTLSLSNSPIFPKTSIKNQIVEKLLYTPKECRITHI